MCRLERLTPCGFRYIHALFIERCLHEDIITPTMCRGGVPAICTCIHLDKVVLLTLVRATATSIIEGSHAPTSSTRPCIMNTPRTPYSARYRNITLQVRSVGHRIESNDTSKYRFSSDCVIHIEHVFSLDPLAFPCFVPVRVIAVYN